MYLPQRGGGLGFYSCSHRNRLSLLVTYSSVSYSHVHRLDGIRTCMFYVRTKDMAYDMTWYSSVKRSREGLLLLLLILACAYEKDGMRLEPGTTLR